MPIPLSNNVDDNVDDNIQIEEYTKSEYRSKLRLVIKIALSSMPNKNTRRCYAIHLHNFYKTGLPLDRASIIEYLSSFSPSARSMGMSALRMLAREAEMQMLLNSHDVRRIELIRVRKIQSVRLGRWLSIEGVRQLTSLPNRMTLTGSRDAALFGLIIGCGLRRFEACGLTWENYQIRDGRAVLVDLMGKGGKVRSIPVPDWARSDIDHWRDMLIMKYESLLAPPEEAEDGPLLRNFQMNWKVGLPVHKLSENGAAMIMRGYSKALGIEFAPHDLRRTLARLMRSSGAPIEQIQFTLGHSSVKTTEKYLGGSIILENGAAAIDKVNW